MILSSSRVIIIIKRRIVEGKAEICLKCSNLRSLRCVNVVRIELLKSKWVGLGRLHWIRRVGRRDWWVVASLAQDDT